MNFKKIALSILLCAFMVMPAAFAFSIENSVEPQASMDEYSMKDIEIILLEYLETTNSELDVGTPEFYDFVVNQLLGDRDVNLENHKDYTLIHSYLASYKVAYDDFLILQAVLEDDSLDSKNVSDMSQEILSENDSILYDANTNEVTFDVSENFDNTTIGDIKAEVAQNEANSRSEFSGIISRAYSGYKASSAISYAKTWGLSRNTPTYQNYVSDCTNFVSQCVYAGGVPMTGVPSKAGTTATTTKWYSKRFINDGYQGTTYDTYAVSTSWLRVEDFISYMQNRVTKKVCNTREDLRKNVKAGDVVFLADANNKPYHAVFISGVGSTLGSSYYCGHTNNANGSSSYTFNKFSASDHFIILKFAS